MGLFNLGVLAAIGVVVWYFGKDDPPPPPPHASRVPSHGPTSTMRASSSPGSSDQYHRGRDPVAELPESHNAPARAQKWHRASAPYRPAERDRNAGLREAYGRTPIHADIPQVANLPSPPGRSVRAVDTWEPDGPPSPLNDQPDAESEEQFSDSDLPSVNELRRHYDGPQALRDKAKYEGKMRLRYHNESRTHMRNGRDLNAEHAANMAQMHERDRARYNAMASKWFFAENNEDNGHDVVDLHGQSVREAIKHTGRAIVNAVRWGEETLTIIVGKGQHSDNGVARLKPAVKQYLRIQGWLHQNDPTNAGRIVVDLSAGRQ